MALNNTVYIYNNDGGTLLFTSTNGVSIASNQTVTETGVTLSNGEVYTYEGNNKFLGVATEPNKSTPDYAIGSTFNYSSPIYIVEEEKEPKVTITYNGNIIASLEGGNIATLQCAGKKMIDDIIVTTPEIEDSPLPIEVATEEEMNALLGTAEIGDIYKYTGETTDTYENGALYVVEELETTYSLTITNTGTHIYNEYIYYSVDSEEYGDLRIEANSTLKIDGIKNYVYCRAGTEFREESTVLNNCTIEWLDNATCKIYPTGDNATATLESYD